jgi:predicted nucleotidyltransferase component of viral defense system
MNLSLEYIERCSAETGFQVASLEKVARLGELAADIARHPFLGGRLALKGGTALNLCFGPPMRLSVDLDFNYIGHIEREKMLEDRPIVEGALADLARRRGYKVQQSADAFAGRKLYLRYRSVLGQNERIEVDLNFIFRVPLAGVEMYHLWQPGDLDRPRVRAVGLMELLIGKLLALLDRGAVRDVWDVANFSASAMDIMESRLFRPRFIALAAILEHPLLTYHRDRLESRITDIVIAERLVPLLARGLSQNARELIERAWTRVAVFQRLAPREEEYINGINKGEMLSELLFPDEPDEAARFAGHPAILWKLSNVRAHLKRTERV